MLHHVIKTVFVYLQDTLIDSRLRVVKMEKDKTNVKFNQYLITR